MKPNLSALDDILSAKEILNPKTDKSPLTMFVQEGLQQLVEEIKAAGLGMDVRASNNLLQSIKLNKLTVNIDGVDAEITADEYWKFINYGVNGELWSSAPDWKSLGVKSGTFAELIQKVDTWRPFRGIEQDASSYVIARSILRRGKVPKPFVTETINETETITELSEGVASMIGKAVTTIIKTKLQNGNNN
jgi:hypothetical protein